MKKRGEKIGKSILTFFLQYPITFFKKSNEKINYHSECIYLRYLYFDANVVGALINMLLFFRLSILPFIT